MEKLASRFVRPSFQASDASQSILTLDSETEKPVDLFNFVRIILCFLGIGSLLSIFTLFSAPDYLQLQLDLNSDQQILYFITPAYILPNLIVTVFMVRYGYYPSFEIRIVSCFIITAICLLTIPILFVHKIISILGQRLVFYAIVLLSAIIGITSAILSTSILAFCQFFPIKYLRTLVIGQSIAMILICLIRIGIKLLFSLQTGGTIYFSISAAINMLCALLFVYIITHSPFVAYYIHPYLASKDRRFIETKIKQFEQQQIETIENNHNAPKTDSRSIRHSVAIIPSQLSYFSNIKHFKHKPIGKQHPNTPIRKDKKHKQSSPLQQINDVNIFYEQDPDECTLSMPTNTLKVPTKTLSMPSNRSASIDDMELKQKNSADLHDLNGLSLSSYSIRSHSVYMDNVSNCVSSSIVNAQSQPNTIKSALMASNGINKQNILDLRDREHDRAKSEIVVYPATYTHTHTHISPDRSQYIDVNLAPQSPQSPIVGYQFNFQQLRMRHPSNIHSSSISFSGLRYEYRLVAQKISTPFWTVFITFFMTYLVFPGLILDLESEHTFINKNDWFPVILAAEFCIFDLFGRQLTVFEAFTDCGKMNFVLSSLRILLYPLFILINQKIILDDNIVYIVVGLCAFTNGFFVCAAFINVPHRLYQHEQEIGAAFMQLASTLSILASSLIALAVFEVFDNV